MAANVGRFAVVTEFKKPKMNKEQFLLELSKSIAVDGRVNVDRYCRVLELVEAYISSNYSKPIVSRSVPLHSCRYCGVETTQPDEECYKCP